MRVLAAAALVLLALAPPADALRADAQSPEDPLEPDVPWHSVLHAEVPCADVMPGQDHVVRWQAESPQAELVVSGPRTHDVDTTPCLTGSDAVSLDMPFQVRASMGVEAERPHDIRFDVRLDNGDAVEVVLPVVVAYTGAYDVVTHATEKMAGPQKAIAYDIDLVNHANGRTEVSFEGERPAQGDLITPEPVVLGRTGEGGERISVTVVYATPFQTGDNDVTEQLRITVSATSARTGAPLAEPQPVELTAHTKGHYVPGPGLGIAAAALGLAFVRSRR